MHQVKRNFTYFYKFYGNNIKDDYYYGSSPKLSLKRIASKIKGDTFINIDKLKEYMLLNGKYFAMHNTINSRKYLEALFSRTLLKVISKYGFRLLTTKETYLEIKELLKLDASSLLKLNIGVEEESKHKYYILLNVDLVKQS